MATLIGTVSEKQVPDPLWLLTDTLPPRPSTFRRTTSSPMPRPDTSLTSLRVDIPEAKIAVVIGGQTSTRQAKQRLGRILRRRGLEDATLYEVVCEDTADVQRSRMRRRSDAYDTPKRWSRPVDR